MIYIKGFGWRLGNQLFHIATGHALARKNNDELVIPEWKYAKYFNGPFTVGEDRSFFVTHQGGFHYRELEYRKHVAIQGYFQSEKFFSEYESDIRSMFSLNKQSEIVEQVAINTDAIKYCGKTCSIHIRRGDYLNYPDHHPTLSPEWYAQAIAHFPRDTVFWVFSDDIAWTKEHIRADNICYSHESDIVDFFTMQKCDNHIIANSSFSWWAAWLNPSTTKKVIAPARWFGPAYQHWNINDLYPVGWTKL